jgi:hypothetical protein
MTVKTPRFKTEAEAAKFWDSHSTVDYLDEWEDVRLEGEPDEDVCRRCGSRMRMSRVDVDLFGKMVIHDLVEYRCPLCFTVRFSTRSLEEIRTLEGRIRRYGLAGVILQNLIEVPKASRKRNGLKREATTRS